MHQLPHQHPTAGDSILFSTTISSVDNTSNDINESSTGSTPSTPTTVVGSGELGSVVHTPNNYGLTTVVYDISAGIKHSERPLLDMLESLSIQQKQYLSQPRQSITRNDLWGKFSLMKISTTPSTKFFPKKSPSSTIIPTNNTKSPTIGKRSRPKASEYQFPHQLSDDDKISVVAALILANNLSINRTKYAEPTTDDIPLHVVVLAVLDKYGGLSENTRIHLLSQSVKFCSRFSADSVGTRIKKPEDYISQDERKKVTIEDDTSTTSSVVAEEREVVSTQEEVEFEPGDWQSNDLVDIGSDVTTSVLTSLTNRAKATWKRNIIQGLHDIDEVIENADSFSQLKTKERLLHYSSINQIKVQQITLLYADHYKQGISSQELKDKILKVLDGYVYYERECKLFHI